MTTHVLLDGAKQNTLGPKRAKTKEGQRARKLNRNPTKFTFCRTRNCPVYDLCARSGFHKRLGHYRWLRWRRWGWWRGGLKIVEVVRIVGTGPTSCRWVGHASGRVERVVGLKWWLLIFRKMLFASDTVPMPFCFVCTFLFPYPFRFPCSLYFLFYTSFSHLL